MSYFSDRQGKIWVDGELIDWSDAKVHVLTHALHYASSVFEGERSYQGNVFKLREHSQRLIDSAKALDMDIPFTVEEIDDATNAVVSINAKEAGGEINNGNCYVRPLAWRGSEGMGVTNKEAKVHVMIAAWPWDYLGAEIREQGVRLGPARYNRPSPDTFPATVKCSGLYTICTLNKNAAKEAGFDDALVLGPRGQIAESTSANLFLVINDELVTPIPDCFLNGITRQSVISLAEKAGLKVVVRDINPQELHDASEGFLTGTAVELAPIRSVSLTVDQTPIEKEYGVPGPITKDLLAAFDQATQGS